jgi:hypothetical protein
LRRVFILFLKNMIPVLVYTHVFDHIQVSGGQLFQRVRDNTYTHSTCMVCILVLQMLFQDNNYYRGFMHGLWKFILHNIHMDKYIDN